jgi:hypothetical protein
MKNATCNQFLKLKVPLICHWFSMVQGWVILRDEVTLIQDARAVANQMRWESRMIEVLGNKQQRLLVCQKTFWKV